MAMLSLRDDRVSGLHPYRFMLLPQIQLVIKYRISESIWLGKHQLCPVSSVLKVCVLGRALVRVLLIFRKYI